MLQMLQSTLINSFRAVPGKHFHYSSSFIPNPVEEQSNKTQNRQLLHQISEKLAKKYKNASVRQLPTPAGMEKVSSLNQFLLFLPQKSHFNATKSLQKQFYKKFPQLTSKNNIF
jgi:hypothetical protein